MRLMSGDGDEGQRRLADELMRRFFDDELDAHVRAILVAEIANRKSGRAYFTFNVVNVMIDVDTQSVTLEDELSPDVEVSRPLSQFAAWLEKRDR
jgi:hypothetical protein